jgi:hypothetical protein
MDKLNKNNKGFGAVELLLLIIIIVLLGIVGWFIYKNHDKSSTAKVMPVAKSVTKTAPIISSSSSTYTGWNSYTSKLEKLTFKYPKTWTVSSNGSLFKTQNAEEENFIINSPNETLSNGLTFYVNVSLDVETASSNVPDCTGGLPIYAINNIEVSGKTLSVVTTTYTTDTTSIDNMYVTDETGLKQGGTTLSCQPTFVSRDGNNGVQLTAIFTRLPQPGDQGEVSIALTPSEYNESTLIQQVLKIFGSISYN